MDKISKQELQQLVVKQPATTAIEKSSQESCSVLMLAGMLHLAASQSRYELTESEIQFWHRQVVGHPESVVQQFFSEHLATSQWMPKFSDWHDWVEAKHEQERYENKEYWQDYRNKQKVIQAWRDTPEYQREIAEIRERLARIVADASKKAPVLKNTMPEIPLAFSPEEEQEIIKQFSEKRK